MRAETFGTTRKRFKALLADRYTAGRGIICPTAHDCVTAKFMEALGVEHINVAGAAPTAVWTGEPECGVVTMTEMAAAASRILGGVNLPGKVAVAQGGNALNVVRAVREYERAGAAMVQIEDQAVGHVSGYIPGKQIVSEEEALGRIKAALYAREDENLVVAARCDAKLAVGGGIKELTRRLKMYVDAGAEAVQPHGMETMEEWEEVGREMRKYRRSSPGEPERRILLHAPRPGAQTGPDRETARRHGVDDHDLRQSPASSAHEDHEGLREGPAR